MIIALLFLALSGFVSSTIIPGTSEAGFVAFILHYQQSWQVALIIVTLANTMGSLTSYVIACVIPHKQPSGRVLGLVHKYGAPLLFFSFTPLIGDALPLAAGWLRISAWKAALFILLGKLARYCFIAYITLRLAVDSA